MCFPLLLFLQLLSLHLIIRNGGNEQGRDTIIDRHLLRVSSQLFLYVSLKADLQSYLYSKIYVFYKGIFLNNTFETSIEKIQERIMKPLNMDVQLSWLVLNVHIYLYQKADHHLEFWLRCYDWLFGTDLCRTSSRTVNFICVFLFIQTDLENNRDIIWKCIVVRFPDHFSDRHSLLI